jgi:uncharacterized membrane protein
MFVYGIFESEERAADALRLLVDAGFPVAEISGLMHAGEQIEELSVDGKTAVARGAVVGAALGALGGAVLAPAAGILAVGPLVAALQGAAIGGAAGVGFGGLAGLGFWREEIDFIDRHVKQGDVLIGVETIAEREDQAEKALREARPRAVRTGKTKRQALRKVARDDA